MVSFSSGFGPNPDPSGGRGPLWDRVARLRATCEVAWYTSTEWACDGGRGVAGSALGLVSMVYVTVRRRPGDPGGTAPGGRAGALQSEKGDAPRGPQDDRFEIKGQSLADALGRAADAAEDRGWVSPAAPSAPPTPPPVPHPPAPRE